jgi:hypothetical protein
VVHFGRKIARLPLGTMRACHSPIASDAVGFFTGFDPTRIARWLLSEYGSTRCRPRGLTGIRQDGTRPPAQPRPERQRRPHRGRGDGRQSPRPGRSRNSVGGVVRAYPKGGRTRHGPSAGGVRGGMGSESRIACTCQLAPKRLASAHSHFAVALELVKMGRWLKAGFVTSISITPTIAKLLLDGASYAVAMVVYVVAVFIGAAYQFKPDERFTLVRDPTLDSVFDLTFEEEFSTNGKAGPIPFRVHVLQPCGWWLWKQLKVSYAYNSHTSHPDYGKAWSRNCGLCWEVYKTKQAGWCHRNDDRWQELLPSEEDRNQTTHVWAVFAIPLRSPKKTPDDKVSGKITAVLAFDALSKEAAEVLRTQCQTFRENRNQKLLDRAAWTSLYF